MRLWEIVHLLDRGSRLLLLGLLLSLGPALPAGWAAPWDPPTDPAQAPLPLSARPGAVAGPTAGPGPNGAALQPTLSELGQAVAQVVSGQPGPGADRLAGLTGLTGDLADVAAYYQGLGRYLAGQPEQGRTLLAPLAGRADTAFLGRDAGYLVIQCAARLGDHAAVLNLATAWLAAPEQPLSPQVLLRAAVAADALGETAKSQDFLRHLSLFAPWTQAAKAGDALARTVRDRLAAVPPGPDQTPTAAFDPDAPATVLLRAEGLVEKRHAKAALALLTGFAGSEPGQEARAEYIRGKALYAGVLRRA